MPTPGEGQQSLHPRHKLFFIRNRQIQPSETWRTGLSVNRCADISPQTALPAVGRFPAASMTAIRRPYDLSLFLMPVRHHRRCDGDKITTTAYFTTADTAKKPSQVAAATTESITKPSVSAHSSLTLPLTQTLRQQFIHQHVQPVISPHQTPASTSVSVTSQKNGDAAKGADGGITARSVPPFPAHTKWRDLPVERRNKLVALRGAGS